MLIAFISYEFPPHSNLGGIATYVAQIALLLTANGHQVEVFCGVDPTVEEVKLELSAPGLCIHRIRCTRAEFPQKAEISFARRNNESRFDILEGPDFLAEAFPTAEKHPEVPFVIRLHTPWQIIAEINSPKRHFIPSKEEICYLWYCLRTGIPIRRKPVDSAFALEAANAFRANLILSPSVAISERVKTLWSLNPNSIVQVGLPFRPNEALLAIPLPPEGGHYHITYVGRLEWRKGVQDLATAIPEVLNKFPSARFRFVGADTHTPDRSAMMSSLIKRIVGKRALASVEIVGAVPATDIPGYYRTTDVCVFPSLWESFGYVLLEAMAAGRACVCTSGSGLAEIAGQGQYAKLVPPASPHQLAEGICELLSNPDLCAKIGTHAREQGLRRYLPETIIRQQVDAYRQAITNHRRQITAQPHP